ncbi:MAG: sulfatase-like hydrolase/transferase [Acidobacteria bacterium]|nr:sulfatase-like hydrolase/transferase [Acidobacteriota bacterium]
MVRVPRHLSILATMVLFLPIAAPAQSSPAAKTSLLLITVDTLRADRLGCYGARRVETPAMDALAQEGVRFANAYAQVPITLPSHTVILSGMYPVSNGVRDFTSSGIPPSVGMLAETFKRQGYMTAAFVSAFVLDGTWGFNRGFDTYDDHFDARQFETRNPGSIERRADATVDRLLAWLKARPGGKSPRQPFFVWLHLFDPHSDYNPPEPYRTRYAGRLYDGEVAYADSQLARLFGELRRSGEYDHALIALLGDHGESLGEHGEDEHGFFVYNATTHVPFILKLPHSEGARRVISQPVGTIDLAPTLLDLLRLRDPIRGQFQGSSLASLALGKPPPAERPVYCETYYPWSSFGWAPLHALVSRKFRFVEAPRAEIYDLAADPGETRNLIESRRSDSEALRAELQNLERRYAAPAAAAKGPPLAPETVEKLKSLGYVAYSAPAAPPPHSGLADPKDRLQTFKSILRATDLAATGRVGESNALLARARAEEPKLYLIPFMLGENAARAERWNDAETQFLACLKLNPTFQQAVMGLARVYIAQGKAPAARPWLELALHENPRNFLAWHGLGLAARSEKNLEEARRWFTRAVEEKPSYAPSQQELGIVLVEMQRYREAIGPLRRAAELGPESAIGANYLGTAYTNTNRLQEGIAQYRRALQISQDYAIARLNLAFALLKSGDRTTARREFQTLCQQGSPLCREYRSRFE